VFVARAASLDESDSDQVLDASLLAERLVVRNWRPGDRFWPMHTKSPKKVKELLQDRNVKGLVKKQWPVIVSGDDIVWIRGFAVPEAFCAKGSAAVIIREDSDR